MDSSVGAFANPRICKCYAALRVGEELVPHTITRRALTPQDVAIDIKYAGICHSDIHQARGEWGPAIFPMVPGHEIIGFVVAVGNAVTKYNVGDKVGVGCMVESCGVCSACKLNEEQYCESRCVFTYNSLEKYPHCGGYNESGGETTYGGYSQFIVVHEGFVLRIPDNLDLAAAAPLLCAGITTYSPIFHNGLKPGQRFAVVGLGGLGHMAVKIGNAIGAHTTVISRGTAKKESALKDLKADAFIDSTNPTEMTSVATSFDLIIDTISAAHNLTSLLQLLKLDGKLVFVGVPPEALAVSPGSLIDKRLYVGGSLIGGIKETQEMLDFCGKHNITCEIELITADQINVAYERTVAGDIKYRFVIDVATI